MKDVTFTLKIDAFKPDEISLERLATYILEYSKLLGGECDIRFGGVRKGSTVLRAQAKPEDFQKLKFRSQQAANDPARADGGRSWETINKMLVQDKAKAVLTCGRSKVIAFPGRDTKPTDRMGPITEPGNITGELIRVGGKDATKHAQIQLADGTQVNVSIRDKGLAQQMAMHLFEELKVLGIGYWFREPSGIWTLDNFKASSFERPDDGNATQSLIELRALGANSKNNTPDILDRLHKLRHH